jgi:hypothetical protein
MVANLGFGSTQQDDRELMRMLEARQRQAVPDASVYAKAMARAESPEGVALQKQMQAARQQAMKPAVSVAGGSTTARPEKPGLLSRITRRTMDALQDPVANAQIVAALNSLRFQPDPNLTKAVQARATGVQERRQLATSANKTADYFRQQGRPQIAAIIEDVPSVASVALEALFKEPRAMSTFEQKLAAVKAANPDMPYSEVVNKVLAGEQPTTILKQMGTVPPGYAANYDEQGNVTSLTPIPGGPAAAKDVEKTQKDQQAFEVYQQAVAGMQKALGATPTGYFMGMLPAVTVGMQKLDAATESFLPTLKDVFRGAGEGTFTEGDQQILTNLVPTRQDAPDVAAFKLEQLDRMVRIKLGQKPATPSADIDTQVPPVPAGSGLTQQEWQDRWSNMTEQERNQFRRQ